MNRINIKPLFLLAIVLFLALNVNALKWSKVVSLEGMWHFTVGDDSTWAKPTTIIDDWDRVSVPSNWERYYEGYNGYGWYRRDFELTQLSPDITYHLFLGQIDDVDEVFLNGTKIGQSGSFFPNYQSAYNENRRYVIPEGVLKQGKNTIAVRVYDEGLHGGMVGRDDIGIFFDNDINLLAVDLSGDWKFSIYRQKDAKEPTFNDNSWKDIKVPGKWETQGYKDYDGTAWYRKRFAVPSNLQKEQLFLVLGKIDDMDRVYLNGKQIGRTEALDAYSEFNRSDAWRLYRVYPIPSDLLKRENVVVVEVYDKSGDGGIYAGPVGIALKREAQEILERKEFNNTLDVLRSVFDNIFNW